MACVQVHVVHFELGLAQELPDALDDVARAPVVALDVGQDLGNLLQSRRVGADQDLGRAGIGLPSGWFNS